MTIILGAYAASPTFLGEWNPAQEREIFDAVAQLPAVRGLELPWFGDIHQHDPAWLLSNFNDQWSVVYTTIQSTAKRAIDESGFGLASEDDEGRRAAVGVVSRVAEGASRLADHFGRQVVEAVELHSQPRGLGGGRGSADALARSLDQLLELDWLGATLLVEHADAAVADRPTPKGYLSLEEELDAVQRFPVDLVGVEINWGRSAIEFRDGDRVVEHIRRAAESGRLRGLFFSGAADRDGPFGNAWDDAHPPFAPAEGYTTFEPTSILTADRAREAIAAAGPVPILGIKIGHRPAAGPVASSIELLREAVHLVDHLSE